MYKLYWAHNTASFAPRAVMEEAGLEYELIPVDLASGDTRKTDYLNMNPTGVVPTLVLPDGSTLYESAAIILYLADHHHLRDLAPSVDDPHRGVFLQSLIYLSNTVQAFYRTFYYTDRFTTSDQNIDTIREAAVKNLYDAWKPVELHLEAQGPYYLGDRFSLADIYLTMLVTWFKPMDDLLKTYPAIKKCAQMTTKRSAVFNCLSPEMQTHFGPTS